MPVLFVFSSTYLPTENRLKCLPSQLQHLFQTSGEVRRGGWIPNFFPDRRDCQRTRYHGGLANPCQSATQLEKEITALEQQILNIEAQMSDPSISFDSSRLASFQHERETIESQLNLLYDKWVTISDKPY